eukprot:SAG11_NODE_20092_length_452_cov_10.028329_1_plen_103_part_00
MYLDAKFSTLQVDLPRYASVNMYLQQYWYLVVYRIYGSRTRYTAGSQQIGRSPWPYAVGSVSNFFYIENLHETLCPAPEVWGFRLPQRILYFVMLCAPRALR